jgi:hypothetical protein
LNKFLGLFAIIPAPLATIRRDMNKPAKRPKNLETLGWFIGLVKKD